eukprot:g14859.t1
MDRRVRQGGGFAKRSWAQLNAASSKLSRKIGWMNNNANLIEEIRYQDVKDGAAATGATHGSWGSQNTPGKPWECTYAMWSDDILSKTGDDEAMMILENLEKKDPTDRPTNRINNPTNYILSSARNSLRRNKRGFRGERKGGQRPRGDGGVPEPDRPPQASRRPSEPEKDGRWTEGKAEEEGLMPSFLATLGRLEGPL